MADLVFIGDVHLDRDDRELPAFLDCLDRLAETSDRIVLMGDLFNLWVGRRELEQTQHTAVVSRLEALRRRGVVVSYVEGNRDYRIGSLHAGRAFDAVTLDGLVERQADTSIFAVHGDLANAADRQYRLWRRVSRSRVAWTLFNLIPRTRRLRWAQGLEQRLRSSNPDFRRSFPEAAIRSYASTFLARGHDLVVLGHFHVEHELDATVDGRPGRIIVLPEWKGSRRHLRVSPDGEARMVDSPA